MFHDELIKSVAIRAARTFLQTFLAVLLAAPALDLSGPSLKAAGVAGLAAVLSGIQRLLDETRVPSLPDHNPGPAQAPTLDPVADVERGHLSAGT
jgi:hypothetical protein